MSVISVENVSKQYRLGQVGTGSLSADLTRLWCRLRGKDDPFLKIGQTNDRTKKAAELENGKSKGWMSRLASLGESDLVWALKDINFQVKEGEVLGIIGRNGAGKSTLLKILARVTSPTTGQVKVRGRIASLLEVGTGFHPDLTGRENIYLNGAILGMRKHEITRKLDEIIDFSGCERYIDTPVKRYSSGMYVRLAFAVAAHLEPEILIVDEVLAVGDAEFQKKCLGKMQDVSTDGRTVLFVSHNMSAIRGLCNQCIVLHNGGLALEGATETVLAAYSTGLKSFSSEYSGDANEDGSPSVIRAGIKQTAMDFERIGLELEINSSCDQRVAIELRITDLAGTPVAYAGLGSLRSTEIVSLTKGVTQIRLELDSSRLANGKYLIGIDLTIPHVKYLQRIDHCLHVDHTRVLLPTGVRSLEQTWGHGSLEIPLRLVGATLVDKGFFKSQSV